MDIIIYARVSTPEQANDGHGLETQIEACSKWADVFKHRVVNVIQDEGKSGKNMNRPGVMEAFSAMGWVIHEGVWTHVRDEHVKGILVHRLDRMTRSTRDLGALIEGPFSATSGCSFMSVTESLDTSNAVGRFAMNILGAAAQFQREGTVERIKETMSTLRSAGMATSGNAPFGWRKREDGKLVPDEREQMVISNAYELRHQPAGAALPKRKPREVLKIMRQSGIRGRDGKNLDWRIIKEAIRRGKNEQGLWRAYP